MDLQPDKLLAMTSARAANATFAIRFIASPASSSQPGTGGRCLAGHKKLDRCSSKPCAREHQQLGLPLRVGHDRNFRDPVAMLEKEGHFAPVGAGFPAPKVFRDHEYL